MGAFLGISLWVALATVIPGLVTVAACYGAYIIVSPTFLDPYIKELSIESDWFWASVAVTVMVLTQAIGILLEDILVRRRWLGDVKIDQDIPKGIDPRGETRISLEPYHEYTGTYILLSELREDEDSQGHLKRALAQFFLTNNTLISFSAGIVAALLLIIVECILKGPAVTVAIRGALYIAVLTVFLVLSYKVARIRFQVMAKSLWAARRRRLKSKDDSNSPPSEK